MEIKVFKYGHYVINLSAQQLTNEDGSPAKWRPRADISRSNGNEDLLVPLTDWPSQGFDTEQEAQTYAAAAAKKLIDSGHCKI